MSEREIAEIPWKTTFEVIDAVKDGGPVTEMELRYAVQNMSLLHNMYMFDLARAINENPISDKTKRGLQRAWDSWREGGQVPLDKRLKGGSYEPGITRDESRDRFVKHTSDTAVKLASALTSIRQGSPK
jgi:hypothetical protein